VTSLPVSVLCLGLGGPLSAVAAYKLLHRVDERVARFAAGWLGVVVPALLTGLALGLQPVIAVDSLGEPLFFPFGWRTVLPALVVPHMVVGVLEGVLTVIGLGLWRADQS
jgi:cobalt/nickel transport system permease protein